MENVDKVTIIAAYSDRTSNWIATDSAGSYLTTTWDLGTKLIHKENYTLGNAGSYRTGDLIEEYEFPDEIRGIDDLREFRDILREIMIEDGAPMNAESSETVFHAVDIIIVSPYGIFTIDEDYQLHIMNNLEYYACGSGMDIALGSLLTSKLCSAEGEKAVTMACEAAILHCTTCGGEIFTKGWEKKSLEERNKSS